MNKFSWQSKLQETVGKTVTGLSDSAARLKPLWADKPSVAADGPRHASTSSSPSSSSSFNPPQEVRLPIDSAKKLRWYDREDLSQLVEVTTKEKLQLQETITALRQVITGLGTSEDELDADLQERLADAEHQQYTDDAINAVLLLAAQAEMAQLRASSAPQQASDQVAALEASQLRERVAAQDREVDALRANLRQKDEEIREQAAAIEMLEERLLSTEAAEAPGTPTARAKRPQQLRPPQPGRESSESAASSSPDQAITDSTRIVAAQGPGLTTPAAAAGAASPATAAGAAAAANDVVLPASKPQEHRSLCEPSERPSSAAAEASTSGWVVREGGNTVVQQESPTEEGDVLPNGDHAEDSVAAADPAEQERQKHLEQVLRLEGRLLEMEAQASAAEDARAAADAELEQIRQTLEEDRAVAERHVQELRAKVTAAQTSQAEMLQRAGEICAEAEERARGADRRADRAEERASRAEADLKAKERERERPGQDETRLAAAKRAADEREAELRRAMRDGEAKLRERIARLDEDNQDLRRSLARARADAEALEARVHQAESAEASLSSELRGTEHAAAERDALSAKCQALEERLSELRSEQGQLATYKEMAAAAEADRGRLEAEVIATAQLATAVEARLRSTLAAKDAAESRIAAAELRAHEVEASIEEEVSRRLELSGTDFARWPRAARDEVARLEKKVETAQKLNATLHAELDASARQRQSEAVARAQMQVRLTAAEERATRADWEKRDAITSLERQLAAARAEVHDWRREAAAAEAERDRLAADRKMLTKRSSSGSLYAGYGGGTPKARGGGSLKGVSDALIEQAANGSREQMAGVDILYLKNVLLKFLYSLASGRTEQCDALLPAIATLVRATPEEYRELKLALPSSRQAQSWWPAA